MPDMSASSESSASSASSATAPPADRPSADRGAAGHAGRPAERPAAARPGGRPGVANLPDPSTRLPEGWHCLHIFYRVDPAAVRQMSDDELRWGVGELTALLDPDAADAPERLQTTVIAGHKADLGLMLMDADPLKIDGIAQRVRASALGSVLVPSWSFVSITEISEYVPTEEQFAERLKREGMDAASDAFAARVAGYSKRLPMMNRQRLYPEMPDWPVSCFYPMNKIREPGANWYRLPFSERSDLMAEHASSGIHFAGRVSQVITASTGLDDWEWGVQLWARTPDAVKDIVYTMRYDKASAGYAEFGPFYLGYIHPIADCLEHLRLTR